MERITRKDHKPRVSNYECYNVIEMAKKLGELEDIEYKLGIDLMTLFKALKNGIVIQAKTHDYTLVEKTHNQIYLKVRLCRINNEWWLSDNYSYIVETKNYGKTWWLKEDKSE